MFYPSVFVFFQIFFGHTKLKYDEIDFLHIKCYDEIMLQSIFSWDWEH